MSEEIKKKATLGRVDVTRKAMRVQELGDKVGFAVKQFEAAQAKFEAGKDSYKEWTNIIKLLKIQIKDMEHFMAVAYQNQGVIHAGRKEYAKAEKMFKTALEIDPDYAVAHYNLAVVYKRLDDPIRSKEHLANARRLGYVPAGKSTN